MLDNMWFEKVRFEGSNPCGSTQESIRINRMDFFFGTKKGGEVYPAQRSGKSLWVNKELSIYRGLFCFWMGFGLVVFVILKLT